MSKKISTEGYVALAMILAARVAWRPFIVSDAWRWFAMPLLPGAVEITWLGALMLCCGWGFLNGPFRSTESKDPAAEAFGVFVVSCPVAHALLYWMSP